MGVLAHVELQGKRPTQHGEQVGVSHAETASQQEVLLRQHRIQIAELLLQLGARDGFIFLGRFRIEQRAESFVQLGGDVVQPFDRVVARQSARRRDQVAVGTRSARYCTIATPSVSRLPSSSCSAGTCPWG